ncbi:hypothetical protein ACFY0B_43760 [Streptomyces sp. NPDC001797]|uniref:Replication protein n=1 Tax=Streptomyces sp. 900105755 TaxID=3154389 RepID=A0ABV1TWE1_9ACTN
MPDARETNRTRLRRLTQMDKSQAVAGANNALRDTWTAGLKPDDIVLRVGLVQLPGDTPERAPLVRLIQSRGIALRFYLMALFEAQCRLRVGDPWTSDRPLTGLGSWSDFIAVDGAYDTKSKTYMPDTKQSRDSSDLRLRQIQSALQTLEGLGPARALVTVPRAKGGRRRLYAEFSLMKETGRGGHQTPDFYTVPRNVWSVATVTVPADFFLNGWIQVLHPSEVATWLILRSLSQWARNQHTESGVYLYGRARQEEFGMQRNSWEDACQRLRDFGLIRHAHSGDLDSDPDKLGNQMADWWAREGRERYEPYRWQVTDRGLTKDALKICMRELTLRQKTLDAGAETRARKKDEPPAGQ